MKANITSNSGLLQHALFTLMLAVGMAAPTWASLGTARGQVFVADYQGGGNDAICRHPISGTLGKAADMNALIKEKAKLEAEIAEHEARKPDPADKAACAAWDAEAERLAMRIASIIARWNALTRTP
jgi:hypothetical protein